MRTIAGPNTSALRSITGYNVGSPLRMPAAGAVGALADDVGNIASGNVQAQSAKGEGARILGDTAKYAAMGAAAGPIGAGVGALVGLTVGLIKNKKAKEAHKEQMAANDEANKANAAQLALAANVNAQKAPATMKSPNERNMAPNKRMEPLKRTMAPIKMAPLKKELSSIQASSSYMRTPASAIERQEIMRTISGASSLQKVGVDPETGVFYEGVTAAKNEQGKRYLKSETKGTIVVDDGSENFDTTFKTQTQKKNKAIEVKENKEKEEQLKKDTAAANERAKANAKTN